MVGSHPQKQNAQYHWNVANPQKRHPAKFSGFTVTTQIPFRTIAKGMIERCLISQNYPALKEWDLFHWYI